MLNMMHTLSKKKKSSFAEVLSHAIDQSVFHLPVTSVPQLKLTKWRQTGKDRPPNPSQWGKERDLEWIQMPLEAGREEG